MYCTILRNIRVYNVIMITTRRETSVTWASRQPKLFSDVRGNFSEEGN